MEDFGMVQNIEILVPEDEVFNKLYILATIENFLDVEEGLEMYVNYGKVNSSVPMPTSNEYMETG